MIAALSAAASLLGGTAAWADVPDSVCMRAGNRTLRVTNIASGSELNAAVGKDSFTPNGVYAMVEWAGRHTRVVPIPADPPELHHSVSLDQFGVAWRVWSAEVCV